MSNDSPSVLLTTADIQKLVDESAAMSAELRDIDARKTEIEARKSQIEGRLNRITALLAELGLEPRLVDKDASAPAKTLASVVAPKKRKRSGASPWSAEIIRLLSASEYGSMSYSELRNGVLNGPLGAALRESEKGYYHSIPRLIRNGDVIKHNSRLFTPSGHGAFMEAVKRGEVKEEMTEVSRRSPMAEAILAFIALMGGGVTAAQIVEAMLGDERFAEVVKKNNSSAYNVIARLHKRDQLIRRGNEYFLPNKDENSKPPPSGAGSYKENGAQSALALEPQGIPQAGDQSRH